MNSTGSTEVSQFANIDEALEYLNAHLHAEGMPYGSPDAAAYLAASGDDRVLIPLLHALQGGGSYIRATAAAALGELGKTEAIPALTEAFVSDSGLYVRCDAALALGRLGADESLPVLLDRFAGEIFEVRKRIVMAVAYFNDHLAEPALGTLETLIRDMPTDNGERSFLLYLVEQGRLKLGQQ